MVRRKDPLRLRTVWLCDIRLGFKACSAELLLEFLHHVEMNTLFLVGDLISGWNMRRSMFWRQSHNNVLYTILGKAERGTKVILVPGNHDKALREFGGAVFGNLEIHREFIHEGAAGRRMLVMHPCISWVQRKFGLPHAVERAVTRVARKRGVDTVVCGHTHHAELREIDGILYCNGGDWLNDSTSLIEDMNGQLRLIDWRRLREQIEVPVTTPVGRAA